MRLEDLYNTPRSSKKMGLVLQRPSVYNINHKLTLRDPYGVIIDGVAHTKSVKKWIAEEPELVWCILYKKHSLLTKIIEIVKPLSLAYDAYRSLKKRVQEVNPNLLLELEQKKTARRLKLLI